MASVSQTPTTPLCVHDGAGVSDSQEYAIDLGTNACAGPLTPDSISVVMFRRLRAWLADTNTTSSIQALANDEEGAVFVEYLTLTLLVAVLCATATLTLGDPLMRLFRFQQAVILTPLP